MLEFINEWVEWLGLTPHHLLAVALALVVSWASTQAVKELTGWHGWRARLIAFLLAFGACYTVAPGWGWLEFWTAVTAGLSAPAAYKVLVAFAGNRWAWVARLSGDKQ